ncbi:hypothetical protein [Archangium sp.]|uniref:hypothetical protein n=1 Tax=Archangium sp. TaxID=1872627 RepID=UPI002ED9E4F3
MSHCATFPRLAVVTTCSRTPTSTTKAASSSGSSSSTHATRSSSSVPGEASGLSSSTQALPFVYASTCVSRVLSTCSENHSGRLRSSRNSTSSRPASPSRISRSSSGATSASASGRTATRRPTRVAEHVARGGSSARARGASRPTAATSAATCLLLMRVTGALMVPQKGRTKNSRASGTMDARSSVRHATVKRVVSPK